MAFEKVEIVWDTSISVDVDKYGYLNVMGMSEFFVGDGNHVSVFRSNS